MVLVYGDAYSKDGYDDGRNGGGFYDVGVLLDY